MTISRRDARAATVVREDNTMQEPRKRAVRRASRAAIALAVSAALASSGLQMANAATTNPNPGALETQNAQLSKKAATEGMVLLENNNHTLPIAKAGNVAVFGVGAYKTVKGGTGSGDVNNRYTISVRQGLENAGYSVTTSDQYYDAMTSAYDTKYGSTTGGLFGPAVDYSSVEQPLTNQTVKPTSPTDTAVYVLARTSGEGSDRSSGAGDYLLSDVERADIKLIGEKYKNFVVLLNVGGVVDTAFFDEINSETTDPGQGQAIDSMLLMSQAGQESGNAVVEVLNGSVNPSGKLTDTWASKYSYYPASGTFATADGDSLQEEYSEGIYVGYRYFDSMYATIDPADPASVVDYPFGYGLSYTDFQVEPVSVTADMDSVTVKARVTNVGTTSSGKEVVQTYFSAPQTGLDKPYQELAGYAKTDVLAPGASQTVTIRYNTVNMASYDENIAANKLEGGNYVIRVGDSSRNTRVAAVLKLGTTTVTEQLANEFTDAKPATELTSSPEDFFTYPTEKAEIAAAPTLTLNTSGFVAEDNSSVYQQDVAVDSTSPYYDVDGSKIGHTTAYIDADDAANWDGTGAPYTAKTGEIVKSVDADSSNTLFDVASGKITMQQFVAGLSVTQLANIVEGSSSAGTTSSAAGAAGYTTGKYESLGIPAMTLSDGPAGLRITQKSSSTPTTYQWGTAWPIGTLLAQTWDRGLVKQVATAVGEEMAEYGVSLWLAPGMNIHRDPLNGRNFEYYSEDPLVTGLTAASMTAGVQSVPGRGVTIKHYFANNQETSRNSTNATIGERAIREIYLKGFEIAVKTAQPMAVMTSYNKVNGTYSSGNYDLNTNLLRGEWGFKGLVMTDWGGAHGATNTFYSGNDLIEPGNGADEVINAMKKVEPTVDVAGLPVYNKSTQTFGTFTFTNYAWSFGGLTLAAGGSQSYSTTVDSSTDLSDPQSGDTTVDSINNTVFTPVTLNSVDDAYNLVNSLATTGTALTAAQKAAISIDDVVRDGDGKVTSYKVTFTGDYPAAVDYTLRLGDLQRSAMKILNIAKQSAGFEELAAAKGVDNITVGSYTAQFNNLASYVSTKNGQVVSDQVGDGPALTLDTSTAPNAAGWNTAAVSLVASTDDNAQVYIGIDSGELRPYTDPVSVTGDGVHSVRAIAVGSDGSLSTLKELSVKIDSAKPTVSATGAKGVLTVTASDDLSGIASVEYSTDGIAWTSYSAPVAIPGAPKSVSYRATDVAGNVSAAASIAVEAGPANATAPVVTRQPASKTTVASGKKVTLTATAEGTPRPVVQWQVSTNSGKTWKNIAGATSTKYSFTAKVSLSGNRYRTVFTNAAGTAYSSSALLTVKHVSKVTESIVDNHITKAQHARVKVSVAPKSQKPTGTVTVHYGSKSKSVKLTAAAKGSVTVTLPKLKKGSYTVYATYSGSSRFASDSSSTAKLTVR